MQQPLKSMKKDSVDIAKSKSGKFASKNMSRNDFAEKDSPLSDSADKYRNFVIDAATKMKKSDLAKKGIMKNITKKGDTIYRYNSNNVNFEETRFKKLKYPQCKTLKTKKHSWLTHTQISA